MKCPASRRALERIVIRLRVSRAALAFLLLATSCASTAPPDPVIVYLLDTSSSLADADIRANCLLAFEKVLTYARKERGTITVETIAPNPLVGNDPPLHLDFANNPFGPQDETGNYLSTEALIAFDELPAGNGRTSILDGFELADRTLSAAPRGAPRHLVICSDLLNTSPRLNVVRMPLSDLDVERELSTLSARGLIPSWDEVSVYVVGAGLSRAPVSSSRVMKIQHFFERFFEKANASLVSYRSTLPVFP